MNEFRCEKCKCDTFKIIKDEKEQRIYERGIGTLKCTSCGEEYNNERYIEVLDSLSEKFKSLESVIKNFSDSDILENLKGFVNDIKSLQSCAKKTNNFINSTIKLEKLLKEIEDVCFEENVEIAYNYRTVAKIINANLPKGIASNIINNENDSCEIKLKSNSNNEGSINISRCESDGIIVNVNVDGKHNPESFSINEPLRVIQVLLRINEMINFPS